MSNVSSARVLHVIRYAVRFHPLDPKDPRESQACILRYHFSNRATNAGPDVGGHDEEGHGLSCVVRVAEKVGYRAGDVGERGAACCSG